MSTKEEYIRFCKSSPEDIPIFYQPWWLDIVSKSNDWDASVLKDKKGTVIGVWPFVKYAKYTVKFILQPVLTPYLGPLIFYPPNQNKTEKILSFEKKVFSELVKSLPQNRNVLKLKLAPKISNWLPFYWNGFKQTTHYTYQLSLSNMDKVQMGYTSNLRSEIKNQPTNITIRESDDAKLAFELAASSYEKQSASIYFDEKTFIVLDSELKKRNARKILIAYRDNLEPIGCVYIFFDRDTAYLPIIGRGNIKKHEQSITKALIDQSIKIAAEKATIYDFEGSMFPQFEKVFRSFGGHQVPYHVLTRIKSKMLALIIDR